MKQIIDGIYTAEIIIMAEMIFTTYIIGYVQVFLLKNFDESDHFNGYFFIRSLSCSALYTLISIICNWFGNTVLISLIFFGFVEFMYICVFWINYIKRNLESKELNQELKRFKENKREDDIANG